MIAGKHGNRTVILEKNETLSLPEMGRDGVF